MSEKPASPTASSSVRLRSTGLADSLCSPTNGFPKTTSTVGNGSANLSAESAPKSPILKSISKDSKVDSGKKIQMLSLYKSQI